jgi:formylglycine-generating enzyme required for sulfatase activity
VTLDAATIDLLVQAAADAQLAGKERRQVLLAGYPPDWLLHLPEHQRPGDQIRSDLHGLAQFPLLEGEPPQARWLRSAAALTGHAFFADCLRSWGLPVAQTPGRPVALRLAAPPPEPPLDPTTPYPLLMPFERADQLGGRDAEIESLQRRLSGRTGLIGLYAPSGYGKTSFLWAGLLPHLRAQGLPAVLHRQPSSPDLAFALVAGLLAEAPDRFLSDDLPGFEAWLRRIRKVAGQAPVLVLDQLEEVFKGSEESARDTRRRVGGLLAATLRPGATHEPLCRWILAYREEFHGPVRRWLTDVFAGAEPPAGLSGDLLPDGPWDWPLPPLGAVNPDAAFLAAVTRPLAAFNGPWHFAEGHAERLAAAFADARRLHPEAPLVPELQVVLKECVAAASAHELTVPEDVAALVHGALQRHLETVLRDTFRDGADPRTQRTHAVLALRRLVDEQGRARAEGLPTAALTHGLSEATLELLAGPRTRLLLATRDDDGQIRWRLSHDRLAEIIAARLGPGLIDPELENLERRIGQRAAQFKETGDSATLSVPRPDARRIAKHGERLLWDETRRVWWKASRTRTRRRRLTAVAIALAVALITTATTWLAVDARHQALVDKGFTQLQAADAQAGESVLVELGELLALEAPDARIDAMLKEKRPWEAAWAAPARNVEAARKRLIVVLLPQAATAEEFGHLVAGSEVGLDPETPGHWTEAEYGEVRDALHARLVEKFGPPPAESEVAWRPIPAGIFRMGGDMLSIERPIHEVHITRPFDLLRYEVTRQLYARFDRVSQAAADDFHPTMQQAAEGWGPDQHPMWAITWYEAWAFAAWLHPRGRLPTEAEWEYAARGGTTWEYWTGDSESDLDAAGWWDGNSHGRPNVVCEKQDAEGGKEHPFDLCDTAGNLAEWTADRWDAVQGYPGEAPRVDPAQRRRGLLRALRGGSFPFLAAMARSAYRLGDAPDARNPIIGFRVARPAPVER